MVACTPLPGYFGETRRYMKQRSFASLGSGKQLVFRSLKVHMLADICEESSPGVFHARTWGLTITRAHVQELLESCFSLGRSRICLHPSPRDEEQQMLVAISPSSQDLPHLHPDKHETLIPLQGEALYLTYDSTGSVTRLLELSSERLVSVCTPPHIIHSIHVKSDFFLFWELSRGPFTAQSTQRINFE